MSDSSISKNGIAVRLSGERWSHIVEEHSEMAGLKLDVLDAIANPDRILEGREGTMIAARRIDAGRHIVVVYREREKDGFVITAFSTTRVAFFDRRRQLWP